MAKAQKKKAAPRKGAKAVAKKAMKKAPLMMKKKAKAAKKAAPAKKPAAKAKVASKAKVKSRPLVAAIAKAVKKPAAKAVSKPASKPASKAPTPIKAATGRRPTPKPAGPRLSETLHRTERFTATPRVFEPMPLPMATDAPIRKDDRPMPWFDRQGSTIPGSEE